MTGIILNADDYGLTRGISDGIIALAEAGRLSATSAMVNIHHWPAVAKDAMRLRDRIAVGLHLNLTEGKPLGAMPALAPDGVLPRPDVLIGRAVSRRIDRAEIRAEIERQLDRFEEEAGFAPDFVDGHHHSHMLAGIRDELVAVLQARFPNGGALVRDSADRPLAILRRRVAAGKAMTAATLAIGFRRMVEGAGFAMNRGFSGFSTFGAIPYAREFDAFLVDRGARHMVMCHPGLPDDERGTKDSIAARRPEEQAYLAAREDLPAMLWHPARNADAIGFPW